MIILVPLMAWLVSLIFTLFSLALKNYEWALYGVSVLIVVTVAFYSFVIFVCMKDGTDDTNGNE